MAVSESCVILPPFRLKAFAAMLAPAGARSADCTVYENVRRVRFPARVPSVACRVCAPIVSAKVGVPPVVVSKTR